MIGNVQKEGTRKHGKHLRVPVLPGEEAVIRGNAAKATLTVAEYLRRFSLGHEIQSTLDAQHISQIAKVNADQGRLGGLLKLWLTDDVKLTACGTQLTPAMLRTLLKQIETTQAEMLRLVQALKF